MDGDCGRTVAPGDGGPPAPLRAVVFDYGGVLATSPLDALRDFEEDHGYPSGSVARVLLDGYADADDAQHGLHLVETGELPLAEFLAAVAEQSPSLMDGAHFDPDAYMRFLDKPFGIHWMMVQRARELRDAGLRVGVLTNNVREWARTWHATIPLELFDAVVDSSDVGLRKPDPRIYALACDRLGCRPAEAVFLDDMAGNVEAARRIGMEGIVVGDPWTALAELDAVLNRRGTVSAAG